MKAGWFKNCFRCKLDYWGHTKRPGLCFGCRKRYQKAYSKTHREEKRLREIEWRRTNPEKVLAAARKWYRNNLERARFIAIRTARKRSLAKGSHTLAEWEQLKIVFDNRCAACGVMDRPLTEDHKIPISRRGTDNIDNIQPLCKPCNSRKHTKLWFARCLLVDKLAWISQTPIKPASFQEASNGS